MRLASLLASLPPEELTRIGEENLRTDEVLGHAQLCLHLESSIKSSRFLADFLINRQPPTFSILSVLLEAADYELPLADLSARANEMTADLRARLDAGEMLARDDTHRVYRRMFYEARRTDNDINASESSLLGVYRREHQIPLTAHFLLEYHSDFREFWALEGALEHELAALRRAGILFEREGWVVLPEDLVAGVMQGFGLDMTTSATRRLLEHVSSADMAALLDRLAIKVSGSRAEREERLLRERIQASAILEEVGIGDLREICRKVEISMQGVKEEVISRLVAHFSTGRDLVVEAPPPPPLKEPRRLNEVQFASLFVKLSLNELLEILKRRDLRQSGTKEQRVAALWEAHVSEANLLSELTNRDLEELLGRTGLRTSGSKAERIERLISHFGGALPTAVEPVPAITPAIAEMQAAYRAHSAAGQQALEKWLNDALQGDGLIRCYMTDVSNPSQQMKNKLGQAVSAKNGLLILALSDAEALQRAEEALAERWATNDEWVKSVACVGLSQALPTLNVEVLVERVPTDLARRFRERIFPSARVVHIASNRPVCTGCGTELVEGARFCSNCGQPAPNPLKSQGVSATVGPAQ
jgi:hypothetical protein